MTVDVEPDIFGITETWIKPDADNSECNYCTTLHIIQIYFKLLEWSILEHIRGDRLVSTLVRRSQRPEVKTPIWTVDVFLHVIKVSLSTLLLLLLLLLFIIYLFRSTSTTV